MKAGNISYRIVKDKIFKYFIIVAAISSALPLLFILYYIVSNGISAISWGFFFELPKPPGEIGGGISNALIGTIILIVTSSAIAIPPAVLLGIYLSESRNSMVSNLVRNAVEVMQGIPSIVVGILVYAWVVEPSGSFSTLSGAIALAIMMLPIISKSTEETLRMIPHYILEASLALGVPYYKTILRVILPSGLSGILTGIIISISRIAGETAPLLFTAFGNPFINWDITEPSNSLPLLIFNYAGSPYKEWHALAWGASIVLIAIVLLLNIISKIISKKWEVKF